MPGAPPSARLCFCAWGGIPQPSIARHEIRRSETWRSVPELCLKISCHPERNLARFLRQMESKDLRFRPAIFSIYFWDGIPAQPMPAKSTQKRSLFAFCCDFSANLSPFRRSAGRPLPILAVGPFAALEGDIQCRHSTRINATIRRLLRTGTGSATRRKPCADRCSEILQW